MSAPSQCAVSLRRCFGSVRLDRLALRATALAAGAAVLAKLVGALKEFVVAGVYGRSDAMEAFLAAALLPALLANLIAESMNQALLPTLVRVRLQQGREAAQRLFSSAFFCLCLLLAAATIALAIAAPALAPLVGWSYGPEKQALALRLFYALSPLAALAGVASYCSATLNTLDRYAAPGLFPLAASAAVLVGAPLLAPRMGIWALALATVAGALLHAVLAAALTRRCGYRLWPRWYGADVAAREAIGQYGAVFLSGIAASGGLLADQAMASMLPAGSVAALSYASRIPGVAASLLAGALSASLTPYFSRLAVEGRPGERRAALRSWTLLAAKLSIPAAALLVVGSRWLVRIAYQHGAFQAQDADAVSLVMAMYALQIPFYVCSRVYYRFLLAHRRSDLILACGAVNLGLDVALNLLLMRLMGVAGIALATSLWSVFTLLFFAYWSYRLLPENEA